MINVKLRKNDSSVIEMQLPDDAVATRNLLRLNGRYFVYAGIAGGALMFNEGAEVFDVSALVIDRPRVTPSLQVASGIMVSLDRPDPDDINIFDIAASLSKLCRYNGHTKEPYCVSEHSCHVHDYVEAQGGSIADRKAALLHDSPEYLVGDMTKPLKGVVGPSFAQVEFNVWSAICTRFGMSLELPSIVKESDLRILFNEKAAVFKKDVDWGWEMDPLPGIEIGFWTWQEAGAAFLLRAGRLGLFTSYEYDNWLSA